MSTETSSEPLPEAAAAAAAELNHHTKQKLEMALYADLALQDTVKEELFR